MKQSCLRQAHARQIGPNAPNMQCSNLHCVDKSSCLLDIKPGLSCHIWRPHKGQNDVLGTHPLQEPLLFSLGEPIELTVGISCVPQRIPLGL